MAEQKFTDLVDRNNIQAEVTDGKKSNATAALMLAENLLKFVIIAGHRQAGLALYPNMRNVGWWPGNVWGTRTGSAPADPMTPATLQKERDNLIKLIAASALLDNDFTTVEGVDIFHRPPWERLKKMNDPDYDPIKVFLFEWETLGLTTEEAYERLQDRNKSFRFKSVRT